MANVFSRSWQITKITFNIINQDKKLLIFPVLSSIFSLLFLLALLVPSIIIPAIGSDSGIGALLNYGLIFVIYLGLAFISTFFNVCVVYAVKQKLDNIQVTAGQIFSYAFSKIHLIILWSLVSATVGLLLRVLENAANKAGLVGQIIMKIVVSIMGMMWGIITVFVVPVMVYNNLTPFKAIGHSVQVLKRTWGESLIRHYGLGAIQGLLIFSGIIFGIVLFALTAQANIVAGLVVLGVMAIYIVILFTVFSVANTVFNTIIYRYGETGQLAAGYDPEMIQGAFRSSKKVSAAPPVQAASTVHEQPDVPVANPAPQTIEEQDPQNKPQAQDPGVQAPRW